MNLKVPVLIVITVVYLYNLLLGIIRMRSAGNPVPENVSDVYDRDTYLKWRAYHAEKNRFSVISATASFILELALLVFNAYAAFARLFPDSLFLQMFAVLLLSALSEGGAYVPVFTVTNPLKESVSVFISVVIDGRATTWGEVTLEAADPLHLSSPWFLSAGSHSIQVYVNGIRLADRSFEVVDQ